MHKSNTLRQALRTKKTQDTCKLTNCIISNTKCYQRGVVYKVTCNKCLSFYIGSTIRQLHERIGEHVSGRNSSIYKHLIACDNNKNNLKIEIIDRERDPVNIRLLEAFYIKILKPSLNSREESCEMDNLLF